MFVVGPHQPIVLPAHSRRVNYKNMFIYDYNNWTKCVVATSSKPEAAELFQSLSYRITRKKEINEECIHTAIQIEQRLVQLHCFAAAATAFPLTSKIQLVPLLIWPL